MWYLMLFKFFILFTNSAKGFAYRKPLKVYSQKEFLNYWKYFSIILSFFSYSLGEIAWSSKLLTFNIKSINPIESIEW